MDYEVIKKELLKHARNAFETASTIRDNQRIEVYIDNEKVKTSDILEESDVIVYSANKVLCYMIDGYEYLEDEIKTWIDYARVIQQPTNETPLAEPTEIETSIRELINEIAKSKGVEQAAISSYEIFANLPMDLLGSIEQKIFEYWWNAPEEENGKKLAVIQIDAALKNI